MPNLRKHLITGCLIVGAVLAATLIRVVLAPVVGSALPFFTFFLVTILLAWHKGFWAAAISLPLSGVAGAHFVLKAGAPMLLGFGQSELGSIGGFVLASLVVSIVIDFQRRTLQRAKLAELDAARTAQQLLRSNDELRRVNRDLELFAYSASHDLREPLRTISLAAQSLERKTAGNDASGVFVKEIGAASRRMEVLMEDILSYIQTSKREKERPPMVESGRVLEEVLERLGGAIRESGAVITKGELPVVEIDDNRLGQVMQNLIGNAIKYRNAEAPRIHVEACRQDGFWVFSTHDNGIGIDPVYREQVFGLFKRLHTQSEYQGSGMGLAICRRIVEQYGGQIWLAESAPGKGSTFCFSIPAGKGH